MFEKYRIGYIDDEPDYYMSYKKKIERRSEAVELILLEGCQTKEDFLDGIYENRIEVLLIDYRMATTFGFHGTTLINYINDHVRDLECFILTAVDCDQITDGLVTERNRYPKTVFDTEGEDPDKLRELTEFIDILKESAAVYRTRREQKVSRYRELLEKKRNNSIGGEEEEFLELYKVLSSYGMVEKLPADMLSSEFERKLDKLLQIGDKILEDHQNN